ncbi:MAG: hypothetical protein AAGD96_24040 [Chloroflexota bacterium]
MQNVRYILLALIMLLLVACSPTAVEETSSELDTPNTESESVLKPVEREETAELEEEIVEEQAPEPAEVVEEAGDEVEDTDTEEAVESDPIDESLDKLPALAESGNGGAAGPGVGGGAIADSSAGADVSGPVSGSLVIDPIFMFENAELVLVTDFPESPVGMDVLERSRASMSADQARDLANKFGFDGPIYQEQLPIEMMAEANIGADGTIVDMPFLAFDDGSQLVLMSGSVWMNVWQNSEESIIQADTMPEDGLLTLTEQILSSYDIINFDYELQVEPFGSVIVVPKYEGIETNNPIMGFYYALDENNAPTLQSMYMDLYSETNVFSQYPLLTAEEAWNNLKPGLEDGTVYWYFDSGPTPIDPLPAPGDFEQPRFWFPTYSTDETISLYGFPSVFNPVAQDAAPLILLGDTLIEGPLDIAMNISLGGEGVFKFTGSYVDGEDSTKRFFADLVELLPLQAQLFVDGTIVIEGETVYVESPIFGRVILSNPPVDLPDGIPVFVSGYKTADDAEGLPILDWQYLNEFIDYGDQPIIAEPLPVDGVGFDQDGFGRIEIDQIELGYGISWPQYDETSREFQPITSDYLIPVWVFSGTTEDGTEIKFEAPAIDDAYFE